MFYSFYKQATVGPCNLPKPAVWDVINKAKWNAWSKLGQMSKDEAMARYVEEIKKVDQYNNLFYSFCFLTLWFCGYRDIHNDDTLP